VTAAVLKEVDLPLIKAPEATFDPLEPFFENP
jgi:hypothetical protein